MNRNIYRFITVAIIDLYFVSIILPLSHTNHLGSPSLYQTPYYLQYDDSKKIKNMSLFIVGEYDVLNDLCIDGPTRLKESAEMTDLELLLQNEPCPPPNRWQARQGADTGREPQKD